MTTFGGCLLFSSAGLLLSILVLVLGIVEPVLPQVVYRVDPLALLAATLRTYQRAGCENEQLTLSCPRGTSISIEIAQYGRTKDLADFSACSEYKPNSLEPAKTALETSEMSISTNEMCVMGQLQYTLLQSVVDICQKKRHCQFTANSPALENGSPCAGVQRFIEVAYKCRPYEFRSKIACENDNVKLVCNPYSRVVIYSASFGYMDRDVVQCSGNRNTTVPTYHSINDGTSDVNKSSCQPLYATETVMHICHGRRRCDITAKTDIFGKPCQDLSSPQQLKIVYTCIPRKVLKKRYETQIEPDEVQQTQLQPDHDELYDDDQFYRESDGLSTSLKIQSPVHQDTSYSLDTHLRAKNSDSTKFPPTSSHNMHSTFEDEEDDFYLYFVTIVVVSVLLCVIIVIGRVTLYRMQSCSHDNDSPTSQGKDKGSALEMCKPTATKFDALSVHEDAINVKGEGNMTNTIAGLPLSPLMTKEPYITYTSLSDNLYDTTDEQFLSTNVTIEHLKSSSTSTSNNITTQSYPINHIRQESFNCPLYVGVKSFPTANSILTPTTQLYNTETTPKVTGVTVSNILVPQGMPITMPMGYGGSFAIPVHQNQLSHTAGQNGIAATSVSVVTTLPRQIAGTRMPCMADSGLPIYYNSPSSYRGAVAQHPFG